MRVSTIVLLVMGSPSFVFAQVPAPTPSSERTTAKGVVREEKSLPTDTVDQAAEAGKAAPKKLVGPSPAAKAKMQAKKKAMAAGAARGRAEFQAALQQQQALAEQNARIEQDRIIRQQQAQQLQKQQMIQQLMPQGQTVVKVKPDGTYETRTYYYYPNPIVPPGMNPPILQPYPSP